MYEWKAGIILSSLLVAQIVVVMEQSRLLHQRILKRSKMVLMRRKNLIGRISVLKIWILMMMMKKKKKK